MSPVQELCSSILVRTERLWIAPLRPSDFERYCDIVCNAATGQFDDEFPKSLFVAMMAFQESMDRPPFSTEGWNEYGVFEDNVGLVGLLSHCESRSMDGLSLSHVGFHFHPDCHGRGWATESVCGLLDALSHQGIGRVECLVHPDNLRSLALLGRIGFQKIGFNQERNEILMGLCLGQRSEPYRIAISTFGS
ncbi:MAG TPA: GNAT family N-acetyltransferase [Fibrobacteraceae bacterium]|nr:GNAT family N-acetyltransferase [Fibrobacteraceae bacterium]